MGAVRSGSPGAKRSPSRRTRVLITATERVRVRDRLPVDRVVTRHTPFPSQAP